MTIRITSPEVEALIQSRLQSGWFKDAEDVILQALQLSGQIAPYLGVPVLQALLIKAEQDPLLAQGQGDRRELLELRRQGSHLLPLLRHCGRILGRRLAGQVVGLTR